MKKALRDGGPWVDLVISWRTCFTQAVLTRLPDWRVDRLTSTLGAQHSVHDSDRLEEQQSLPSILGAIILTCEFLSNRVTALEAAPSPLESRCRSQHGVCHVCEWHRHRMGAKRKGWANQPHQRILAFLYLAGARKQHYGQCALSGRRMLSTAPDCLDCRSDGGAYNLLPGWSSLAALPDVCRAMFVMSDVLPPPRPTD